MAPSQRDEIEMALSLLQALHKEHPKQLLRNHKLSVSGNKEDLFDRLKAAVLKGTVPFDELVTTLDEVEEHGHHHVFLYSLPAADRAALEDVNRVRAKAVKEGHAGVFNVRTRVLDKPTKRTCTSIRHDGTQLIRVKWIERRTWEEPLKERDRVEAGVRWRGYKQMEARAVSTLRVNFKTGGVELRISDEGRQSRADYKVAHDSLAESVAWLFDWSSLQPVQMSRAIPRIKLAEDEVSLRRNDYLTHRGMKASFISDASDSDLRSDPVYAAGENATRIEGQEPLSLNGYWLPINGTPLTKKIHTYLYADGLGNEVRFPADSTEAEIGHVLSRIREFARP